jgi:hypothetical protein
MKAEFLRAAAAALVAAAVLFLGNLAQAQEAQFASTADLNTIYSRLADLESRLAASNNAGGGCGCCAPVCDSYCDDCCNAGYIAGAELLFLTPYDTYDNNVYGANTGFRLWAGYQRSDGLGVRLRYFDFESPSSSLDDLEIKSLDAEVYDRVQLNANWDLYIGGGVRWLEFGYYSDSYGLDDSLGPVITAELYRYLSDRSALYVIGRESLVFDTNRSDVGYVDTMNVVEVQMGAQFHRDWNGGLLFARAGLEAQHYLNGQYGYGTIGLVGGVISLGIMR